MCVYSTELIVESTVAYPFRISFQITAHMSRANEFTKSGKRTAVVAVRVIGAPVTNKLILIIIIVRPDLALIQAQGVAAHHPVLQQNLTTERLDQTRHSTLSSRIRHPGTPPPGEPTVQR